MNVLERLVAVIVRTIVATLSEPGVLAGLLNAWRTATEPKIMQPSKPNEDDEGFIESAAADGWGSIPL